MTSSEWIVSVDDHVLESPNVWVDRLPAKYKEIGPRLETNSDGEEAWVYEDKRMPTLGIVAVAGQSKDDYTPDALRYADIRPGCYDPVERVKDMDQAGILVQTPFPSYPRFCGQVFKEAKDKDLALLCVQAWNDFMIDEWCGAAPGRFIPLAMVPLWDPRLAAKEAERAIEKGARGIIFSEQPYDLGLPSIHDKDGHWKPLFSVANDANLPICTHIGSSSTLPQTSPDAPTVVPFALSPMNLFKTLADYIFSGLFFEFPNLKLVLAEGGIGWIPYALMWLDHTVDTQRWAEKSDYKVDQAKGIYEALAADHKYIDRSIPPSRLFRDHVYGCFLEDHVGMKLIDEIGVDNVMLETDYPHSDGTWPNSLAVAEKELAEVSDEVRRKIMFENALRIFQYEAAEPPL